MTFIPFSLWAGSVSASVEPSVDPSVLQSVGIGFSWNNLILPPVLASLLVAVLVWFFLRMRYRNRQQQHLRLDHETEDRIVQQQKLISELQLHNDQLKISKANLHLSISEKDRFISILIHDLRSPLRYLYKNTAYLFRNWKRDSHAELDDLITEINNSTKQIHFLTEEMMQWISTQDHTYGVRMKEYLLPELIDELEDLYKENILHHGNTLQLDIPTRMKVITDKLLLKTILRNLIDNANKNTDDGTIRIEARQAYQKVVITVSDSGVGVSPTLLRDINRYFSTSEPMPGLNTQFGHEIIRDFARLLNATVLYETVESGGLRVSLTLPY
ncbi:sensor histidine kinase [Larkinella humicola]|nr:HAMP domain-containing sensor histidine kinase [Larkinella humicola]